jgi:hypothetical protein
MGDIEVRAVRCPRVVGRDGEMAQLRAALDEARRSRGSAVAVVGPPGIGKSRLVAGTQQGAHRAEALGEAERTVQTPVREGALATDEGEFGVEQDWREHSEGREDRDALVQQRREPGPRRPALPNGWRGFSWLSGPKVVYGRRRHLVL